MEKQLSNWAQRWLWAAGPKKGGNCVQQRHQTQRTVCGKGEAAFHLAEGVGQLLSPADELWSRRSRWAIPSPNQSPPEKRQEHVVLDHDSPRAVESVQHGDKSWVFEDGSQTYGVAPTLPSHYFFLPLTFYISSGKKKKNKNVNSIN